MAMVTELFNIFLVRLDPTTGAETAKTRPCVVVSPDELNRAVSTVIIAPMTTTRRGWPTRVEISFQGKTGEIALDQIRAVDKSRLVKRLGIDRPMLLGQESIRDVILFPQLKPK
jgi:mRNA interferase MazF